MELLSRSGAGRRIGIQAGDNRPVTDHGRFRRRLGDPALQSVLNGTQARLESCGWTLEWFLLTRAANAAADRLGIPKERAFTNIHKFGNTSAAACAIALDEANRTGVIKPGNNVLLVAFGAGFTWAASVVRW